MLKKLDTITENRLRLADAVETIPDCNPSLLDKVHSDCVVEKPTERPDFFSMRWVNAVVECGTVGCILGVACALFGETKGKALGLRRNSYDTLFMPEGYYQSTITAAQAAKVIRHWAITDEVDWSIIN